MIAVVSSVKNGEYTATPTRMVLMIIPIISIINSGDDLIITYNGITKIHMITYTIAAINYQLFTIASKSHYTEES